MKPRVERAMPHSLDAEKAILGAALLNDEAFPSASDVLEASAFYRAAHQRIFAAMGRLHAAGQPIELVTLKDALVKSGDLDEVGGPVYLSALVDGVPRSTNVLAYARIVLEKARLRATIETATKLTRAAYEGDVPAVELVTTAAEQLTALGSSEVDGQAVLMADLVASGMSALEASVAQGVGAVTGLSTGFTRLDDMTAGLQPSDLIILAARTSQGKTALAMNLLGFVAKSTTVLMFSLEMNRHQLFLRMLASEARVDSHALRSGCLADEDWRRISDAIGTLSELKVVIDDRAAIGVREVLARARQVQAQHGLGLIVVDYIQLMKGRGSFDTRTQEIGSISRGLKAVGKTLNVPVVALAQLSRASEGINGRRRRPQLSDLAESGSLENDADVVLFIYRPEAKDDGPAANVAELIVAKARNGPTGVIKIAWNPSIVRFENLAL